MDFNGGSRLGEILEELSNSLDEYYGSLNEVRLGISGKVPEKPAELILFEQTKATGLPVVEGSLMDQPYIWLQQIAVITNKEDQWRRLIENATKKPN